MQKRNIFGKRAVAVLSAALLAMALAGCSAPAPTAASSSSSSAASSAAEQASTFTANVSIVAADDTDIIDVATADFQPIQDKAVELSEGATAFDALQATGADVVSENGDYGIYVISINGVSNGSAGAQSGWTYTVNGESPVESPGNRVLGEGDSVVWTFVTSFE